MKERFERLADAELDIMRVVWKSEKPLKASEITKLLQGERSWKTQTAHVLLSRLCDKGYLTVDKSAYSHTFAAAISSEQYFAAESEMLIDRLGGSLPSLIASLIDTSSVSDEEIEEIEKLLEAKKEGRA